MNLQEINSYHAEQGPDDPDLSEQEVETIQVKVVDRAAMKRAWGSGIGGVITRTITLPRFMQDGTERMNIRGYNGYEDGDSYHVNQWDLSNGKTEYYEDAIKAAEEFAQESDSNG